MKGRIYQVILPESLWLFDNTKERMISLDELIKLRIEALAGWWFVFFRIFMAVKIITRLDLIRRISRFQIWRFRITTCTHMVHWRDRVYFYNHQRVELQTFCEQLSDGGIKYPEEFLHQMANSICLRLPYQQYLVHGGNFTAQEFACHPVFSHACDKKLWKKYVKVLDKLSRTFSFFHVGIHSGWVPQNILPGYGRAISLGYAGDAWYPPNNSTLGHATYLLPKDE